MEKVVRNIDYRGIVDLPASKSDSQRVILAAGLAEGTSFIRNIGICEDELAMLSIIQSLGATIDKTDDGLAITGTKGIAHNLTIDARESGLATRLLSGVFAYSEGQQTIKGEGSLFRRRFDFYPKNEVIFQTQVTTQENYQIPITFNQKAQIHHFIVNGGESSQDISGILYGLAFHQGEHHFEVTHLKSKPYLQMTIKTLSKFGVTIKHQDFQSFQLTSSGLKACNYKIEGDWSSASFWLVAAALGKNIQVEGLDHNSWQADKQLLTVLTNSNCSIIQGKTTTIEGGRRHPVDADLTHCPDLFPALTSYAALTPGTSRLDGIHRLINKESNRAEVLVEEFSKLGIHLYTQGDSLFIEGQESIEGGITVDAHNDHRIAMCLAVIGMFADSPITITGAESVKKSYPLFWEDLQSLEPKEELDEQ